jgi:hypothetical protein
MLAACGQPSSSAPTALASARQDAPLLAQDNEWGAFDHHQATDARGHTLAVWEQFDGQRYNIWANRKALGQSWGVAQLIEADNAGSAYNPHVAIDSQGNAVAVWQQFDGQHSRIAANRMAAGTGWGDAALVANSNVYASAPHIANDGQGHLFVLWQVQGAKDTTVHAKRYIAGAGWASELLVKTAASDTSYPPAVFGVAF